jgi:two-component system sensor histidine kinase CpxA
MNTLFAKILLWFWATMAVSVVVSALASALTEDERPSPVSRLVSFQLVEARHAYESGGRQGLGDFLQRFHSVYRGPASFTDAAGRDVLTGESHAGWVAQARRHPNFPVAAQGRKMRGRGATDGAYWFFFAIPERPVGGWFLLPEHWGAIGLGVLFCYWLAYYLTTPVRRLQKAVERFGGGELSARAGSNRRDELGQLARTFDQMADRIEMLLAAERRLLLDISHELRSPLARLGVAIELARSGDGREAALDRIEKESERLNKLVGELLQVTRAEGDPASRRVEPVRLDQLLKELAEDAEMEARAHDCQVEWKETGAAVTDGDPELLRRAIENVIRNAIRYAPPGTRVEITLERKNGLGVIRVRDYGPGVPEDSLPRIFNAFYRVEGDRNRAGGGGAGLGLSIARRAVELHKGHIRARNAHPGLLVEMELPVAA